MCQFATPLSDDLHTKPEVFSSHFQAMHDQIERSMDIVSREDSDQSGSLSLYLSGTNYVCHIM